MAKKRVWYGYVDGEYHVELFASDVSRDDLILQMGKSLGTMETVIDAENALAGPGISYQYGYIDIDI